MNIETKFAIGDKVWLLQNYKAIEMEIRSISITSSTVPAPAIHITYCGDDHNGKLLTARQQECFFSKAALIDYIASE